MSNQKLKYKKYSHSSISVGDDSGSKFYQTSGNNFNNRTTSKGVMSTVSCMGGKPKLEKQINSEGTGNNGTVQLISKISSTKSEERDQTLKIPKIQVIKVDDLSNDKSRQGLVTYEFDALSVPNQDRSDDDDDLLSNNMDISN